MIRIASIVLNNFTNDNRVLKENLSFQAEGFSPFIIAMHEEGLAEKEMVRGIEVIRIKLETKNWPKNFFISAIKFFEFLTRAFLLTKNSAIVHCNDLETLPIGYFRKIFSPQTKLVYDAHEFEIYRTSTIRPSRLWLNKKIERSFIKKADAVITVSDSIADAYEKMYAIKRPFLIYNCPPVAQPISKKYNLFREKFGIAETAKIFLYQGALTIGRGVDQILETFKDVDAAQYAVVFMGYGTYKTKIESYASKSNAIFYHPAVKIDKIERYSNSADWGLLTIENISKSYNFSLPNKLFEYANAEIPVLAFPTFEISKKIKHYKLGLICEDFSEEALIKAITKTQTLDVSQFKAGFEELKKEFTWENQEQKLIQIYRDLL